MMFAIPLLAGARFGTPASPLVKLAASSGLAVTLLAVYFNAFPIVDVPNPVLFGVKVLGTALAVNVAGAVLYLYSRRTPYPATS